MNTFALAEPEPILVSKYALANLVLPSDHPVNMILDLRSIRQAVTFSADETMDSKPKNRHAAGAMGTKQPYSTTTHVAGRTVKSDGLRLIRGDCSYLPTTD